MSVRRLLAILAIAAFGALAWGGATAGAQTTTTTTTTTATSPTVFTCTFELSATQLAAGGGTVQLTGVGPASATVHIFVNGVQAATAQTDAHTGAFGPVSITITTTSTVSVSLDNYPATPCIGPGSVSVAAAAAALPRTGSNDTKPFVLIGIALLVIGTLLVLATRRRERLRGRG